MNDLREAILGSLDRFFNSLESFSGAILVLFDLEGRILDHSPSLSALIGGRKEFVGENFWQLYRG